MGYFTILLKDPLIPNSTTYCTPREFPQTSFQTLIQNREEWGDQTPDPENALSFYSDGTKLNEASELRFDYPITTNSSLAIREALK